LGLACVPGLCERLRVSARPMSLSALRHTRARFGRIQNGETANSTNDDQYIGLAAAFFEKYFWRKRGKLRSLIVR